MEAKAVTTVDNTAKISDFFDAIRMFLFDPKNGIDQVMYFVWENMPPERRVTLIGNSSLPEEDKSKIPTPEQIAVRHMVITERKIIAGRLMEISKSVGGVKSDELKFIEKIVNYPDLYKIYAEKFSNENYFKFFKNIAQISASVNFDSNIANSFTVLINDMIESKENELQFQKKKREIYSPITHDYKIQAMREKQIKLRTEIDRIQAKLDQLIAENDDLLHKIEEETLRKPHVENEYQRLTRLYDDQINVLKEQIKKTNSKIFELFPKTVKPETLP